ncbi:uncharacterized protein LOC108628579 isoform X2 [Ceratina calcarata]|uniref:Uncharacterized protein LOC108628579 isoform X2 n=1 Tax=Ceratina calcarata TaxID=156304 RepID=A0AAJ7J7M2_9HYME|nr:uncharacterized protein LOC108628579 isoform X2 [Ceratina calcarata]
MMVLLDVLQFNYYVDNEIARNDMKNFAEMLGKTFNQYKKLWNEYLKLRKHCEDADFKIPFQLLEPDNCNINAIITSDMSQVPSEHTEASIPLCENVPNSASSAVNPYVDVQSENDNSKQKQKDELLKSPILTKKHDKQNNFNTNDPVSINLEKNMAHSPSLVNDVSILYDTTKGNIYNEKEEKDNSVINDSIDQIECTPISKMSKKLGVSKLYNVDTTVLQNGKKLRQSTLVMLQDKQFVNTADDKMYNKSECLNWRVSPKRNEKLNKSGSLEEEIVQRSPSKNMKSQFKMRSLQLKRKFTDVKANNKSDSFRDKSNSENKLSTSEINNFKYDQYPSNTNAFKQKTNSCSKAIGKSNNTPLNSRAFSNAENLGAPVQEIKKEIITQMEEKEIKREVITQKEKNICSDLPTQMPNASSSQNDETYFDIEQVKNLNCNKNVSEDIKNNKSNQKMLLNSPPVKKRQISKFDIFPDKEDVCYDKVPKKKSEREKLNGITCWECKQMN